MSFGENLVFVWICTCGERMKVLAEPDSTPEFPRYRVQHGPNPEIVSWHRLSVRGLELRGKDLVCWCPLEEPCHADVLLEWANRGEQGE